MRIDDLIEKLEGLRARFDGYDARVRADKLIEDVLHDLQAVQQSAGDEWLSLHEASLHSGYSPEHLRRLVREGRLTSMRRGRRRYIRIGDLPRKPLPEGRAVGRGYDPAADARRIAGATPPAARRRGRSHGS